MGSPKTENHNTLYEIEEVLKEISALLEETRIEHKGLFPIVYVGFDRKEIIANIRPDPRNGEQSDVYLDEKSSRNRFKIAQANSWPDEY